MADRRDFAAHAIFVSSAMIAIVVATFCIGVLSAMERSPLVMRMLVAKDAAIGFFRTGIMAPPGLLVRTPPNAATQDVAVSAIEAPLRGWRVVNAFDKDLKAYAVKLFDSEGRLAHEWRFRDGMFKLDPVNASIETPHGLVVLNDGGIVLNSDLSHVIAAYDACGRMLWRRDEPFHHQITLDEDGFLWVWRGKASPHSQDQWIDRLDPENGRTVESISLREDILGRHPESLALLGLPPRFARGEATLADNADADIFHPNDVEPLPSAYADKFPEFAAGDLLISFRNMDLVAVVDRKTHAIKWAMRGPWRRQHDPDFMPTGEISLFNNNSPAGPDKTIFEARSSIMAVNPRTGGARYVLSGGPKSFYSTAMGAHTWIGPSHIQVVAPEEGRVIEIDLTDGHPVFEFNNRVTKTVNASAAVATWLPEGYFTSDPRRFACQGG